MPEKTGENLTLREQEIINDIEYLLFVDHEEDMKNFQHLKPIVTDLMRLVVKFSNKAVGEWQREMTERVACELKEAIGGIVVEASRDKTHDW